MRVIRSDEGHRVGTLAHSLKFLGDHRGPQVIQILHDRPAPDLLRRHGGRLEGFPERSIELLGMPLQNEAEGERKLARCRPLSDQRRRMKADRLGSHPDPGRIHAPDRQATIQHTIDRGDAYAGRFGDVGDRRAAGLLSEAVVSQLQDS